MKAIFVTGGKQYYVEEGSEIFVEKLEAEEGSKVNFDTVVSVGEKVGTPYVKGAKVTCEVLKHGKQKNSREIQNLGDMRGCTGSLGRLPWGGEEG